MCTFEIHCVRRNSVEKLGQSFVPENLVRKTADTCPRENAKIYRNQAMMIIAISINEHYNSRKDCNYDADMIICAFTQIVKNS